MKRVVLSANEMKLACQHGVERYISALERRAKQFSVLNMSDVRDSIDLMSCMAEMAAAKGLGLYWSGVEGINSPDVGEYEVRSTTKLNGKLIIGEKDKDDQKVMLVTCDPPNFNLVGWMIAGKVKLRNDWIFKSERGRCWMAPQSALEKVDAAKIEQASGVGEDQWMLDL